MGDCKSVKIKNARHISRTKIYEAFGGRPPVGGRRRARPSPLKSGPDGAYFCLHYKPLPIVMSMYVWLSVRSHNSKTTRPNFTIFFIHEMLSVGRPSSEGVVVRKFCKSESCTIFAQILKPQVELTRMSSTLSRSGTC